MSVFITVLIFIAILVAVILIHELGHFITAKLRGVRVEELGLGFPPRILSFKRGDTVYSLNLIPIGGFCRMAGEEDPDVPGSLAGKSIKTRLLILSAGSLFMLLFPVILLPIAYMIPLERPVEDGGVQVAGVAQGSPAELAGIESGDIIRSIDGQTLDTFDELDQAVASKLGSAVMLLLVKDSTEVEVTLIPRTDPPQGQGPMGVELGPVVAGVAQGSPADLAGIETGDIILSIDGQRVRTFDDVEQAIDPKLGSEVTLLLVRNSTEVEVTLIPRTDWPQDQGPMGVELSYRTHITESGAYWPWEAIPKGLGEYGQIFVSAKNAISLIGGEVPLTDAVAGPIGIAHLTGEVAKRGAYPLIWFTAVISMSLAIVNLLPIPGLDGGRIVFVAIEGIRRGKRISPKKEGLIHFIGFAMLLILIVLVSYKDVMRIISGEGFG